MRKPTNKSTTARRNHCQTFATPHPESRPHTGYSARDARPPRPPRSRRSKGDVLVCSPGCAGAARSEHRTGNRRCSSCTSPSSRCPPTRRRRPASATASRCSASSNEFYDSDAGSQIYQDRLAEYQLVDEVGFDGIMLNEHHNAPFCMQPQIQIWASILAAVTNNVKIVLLGVPLPLRDNPVATAEELGMIDMISQGRLVPGLIRGGGTEQFAMNANPAYNRDRLEEAHDLIIKTWTTPGPFRWEGDQYHFRVVNPWALPMQKPHPRIWVPGTSSLETVQWAAGAPLPVHRPRHGRARAEADHGHLQGGRRRERLRGRHLELRPDHPLPRAGHDGARDAQRARVHVDGRRVHRPRPPGVELALGLPLGRAGLAGRARAAARRRGPQQPAHGSQGPALRRRRRRHRRDAPEAPRRPDLDHGRPGPRDRPAAQGARADAARHRQLLRHRRPHQPPRQHAQPSS